MSKTKDILSEFQEEAKTTRKFLERVPMDKKDYKPHEKNNTLGKLAAHVAEIPGWFSFILKEDDLDFSKSGFKPFEPTSKEELLTLFEKNIKEAEEALKNTTDDEFEKKWTMRNGDEVYISIPKGTAIRVWCLNHWYHHRAQLGLYLRLLDIPVPGTYGPSADEQH